VTDGCDHRQLDGAGVESAAGGAAPDAAAPARRGMAGDRRGAILRTGREQAPDLRGEPVVEGSVLAGAALRVAGAPPGARLLVGQAFLLGAFERGVLDEQALARLARRVSAASPAARNTR
jgi:hypothetical protein